MEPLKKKYNKYNIMIFMNFNIRPKLSQHDPPRPMINSELNLTFTVTLREASTQLNGESWDIFQTGQEPRKYKKKFTIFVLIYCMFKTIQQ